MDADESPAKVAVRAYYAHDKANAFFANIHKFSRQKHMNNLLDFLNWLSFSFPNNNTIFPWSCFKSFFLLHIDIL